MFLFLIKGAVEELKAKKAELKKALESYHEKEHQLKLAEINQKNELKEHEANESEKRSAIRSYTAKVSERNLLLINVLFSFLFMYVILAFKVFKSTNL